MISLLGNELKLKLGYSTFRYFSAFAAKNDSKREIIYRLATPEQYPAIVDLMYVGFFSDEPMCKALGLYDGTNRFEDGDNYVLGSLEQCLSMVALDAETDKVLGMLVDNYSYISLNQFSK